MKRRFVDYKVSETKFAGPTMFSRGETIYTNQRGERVAKQWSTAVRYRADVARDRGFFEQAAPLQVGQQNAADPGDRAGYAPGPGIDLEDRHAEQGADLAPIGERPHRQPHSRARKKNEGRRRHAKRDAKRDEARIGDADIENAHAQTIGRQTQDAAVFAPE